MMCVYVLCVCYKHTHICFYMQTYICKLTHTCSCMHIYTHIYTNAHGNSHPWSFVLSCFEILEMKSLFIWGLPGLVVPTGEWGKGAGNSFSVFWASESFPGYHILFDDAH